MFLGKVGVSADFSVYLAEDLAEPILFPLEFVADGDEARMTIEVHLGTFQTVGFAATLGNVECIEVALLYLRLIGGIDVEMLAAIDQTAGVNVEAAEVHVVRIVAIILGRTVGEEVEVGLLLHRSTLGVVAEAGVEALTETGLGTKAESVNAFHEVLGFLIERDVLVTV